VFMDYGLFRHVVVKMAFCIDTKEEVLTFLPMYLIT
jgi:hypothetical protein